MKRSYLKIRCGNIVLCMFAVFTLLFIGCSDDDKIRMPKEGEVLTESILLEQSENYVKYIDYEMWGSKMSFDKDTIRITSFYKEEKVWNVYFYSDKFINSKLYGDIKCFHFDEKNKDKFQEYVDNKTILIVNGDYKYMYSFIPNIKTNGLIYTVWDLSEVEIEITKE